MKKIVKSLLVAFIVLFSYYGCKTSSETISGFSNVGFETKSSEIEINLGTPINSAGAGELEKAVYKVPKYSILQDLNNRFKDNAPFVEILDNGSKERLWFSSSRADDQFFGNKSTNFYQQIYFSEREIGEGKCPAEGWSEPQLFQLETNNPMLKGLIDDFNNATKGAVAIAGGKMIIACDQINSKAKIEFRQLWEIDDLNGTYGNPRPLHSLSGVSTWESQPSLSANGKHLFFVSNRAVNADFGFDINNVGESINIFYSFFNNNEWQAPVLVKELYTTHHEATPHISSCGKKLYFASNKSGDYEIYEVEINLDDDKGGYSILDESPKKFTSTLIDLCSNENAEYPLNGKYNQQYPFYYFNPENNKVPQAFFWASDNPKGLGSFDIYACAMPFEIELNVLLVDKSAGESESTIEKPLIALNGASNLSVAQEQATFKLYSGLKYQLKGGSMASVSDGTFYCDLDPRYIMIGYSEIVDSLNPGSRASHDTALSGASVSSALTAEHNYLPVFNVLENVTINDTVFITKAWMHKPKCPDVLDIPPKHSSIAYFQTGFWEVNTSANLTRDLKKLHEGFEVVGSNDVFNPQSKINFQGTDYRSNNWESLLHPIKVNDTKGYSIAHARWIELHPNNFYWGDRPGYDASTAARMKGRRDRIAQYVDFAQKVDENLTILTDTIKYKYIDFLNLHKNRKPKLLIEIFAVSDQREVLRGWYIGDTVAYRGSEYIGDGKYKTESVKIVPPKVNEKTKTVEEILNCTIELNERGNNGTNLGISTNRTELNTNLSRLRAWSGYKEVYNKLAESADFMQYLNNGKVALPDNNVEYDDAEIVIITRGRRIDVIDPKEPYPSVNNPNRQGFYDYDQIRRVEVRIRLLFEEDGEIVEDFCCFREKAAKR